ncbi:MAG: hypothetical protein KDN20_26405 [Verrucomicrobiae bacterium]|nr:hypothetical protein [Verrucomicrobiae bacterium]
MESKQSTDLPWSVGAISFGIGGAGASTRCPRDRLTLMRRVEH